MCWRVAELMVYLKQQYRVHFALDLWKYVIRAMSSCIIILSYPVSSMRRCLFSYPHCGRTFCCVNLHLWCVLCEREGLKFLAAFGFAVTMKGFLDCVFCTLMYCIWCCSSLGDGCGLLCFYTLHLWLMAFGFDAL